MLAQPGDRAAHHRARREPLADLARELGVEPLAGIAPHERQRLAHPVVRDDVQEGRLAELHRERLRQRRVEDGLARLVLEAGEQDLVPLRERLRALQDVVDARGQGQQAQQPRGGPRPEAPQHAAARSARRGLQVGGGLLDREHRRHPLEVRKQLGSARVAVLRLLGEQPIEHRLKLLRHRGVDPVGGAGLAVEDAVEHRARERRPRTRARR